MMKNLVLIFLLFPAILIAQDHSGEDIRKEFNDYYRKEIPLKAHLFLNQTAYFPGDTIFFKASLFTVRDLLPIAGHTVLNVLLKDLKGKTIVHQMIRLRDGHGHNQMIIPAIVPYGRYILEAYTDWMKNFDASRHYQKIISIGEPVQIKNFIDTNALRFYPEGGNFVAGVNHKIVIQGKALSKGEIFNKNRHVIATFALDHHGLGFVYITPQLSERYSGKLDDETEFFPLPEPKDDGVVVLATTQDGGSALRVIIQMPATSALRQNNMYLTVSNHGNIFYEAHFQMQEREFVQASIPLDKIPAGVGQLTLFKADKTQLCERLFFIRGSTELNPVISLQQAGYGTREKISVTCKLSDGNGQPVKSKMAVSVSYKEQGPPKVDDKNIVSNLLFYGDLPNTASATHNFFSDQVSYQAIDNYLITQPLIYPMPSAHKRKYFINNIYLTGKALTNSGIPLPDSSKITFFLQKSVSTYQAYVKDSAFQVFFLMDFYGEEDIFYRAEYKGKRLEDVKITLDENPVHDLASMESMPADPLSFAAQRKHINQSFSFYDKDTPYTRTPEPHNLLEDEIFGADFEIKLNDYILFPTMEETIREVVPMVQHRIIRGKNVVRVFIDELDQFAEGSPLFVIDGVMTEDIAFFLSLKPSEVSSLKIIHSPDKLDVFGPLGKGGIILVETKIPDHAAMVPKGETTFSAIGLSESIKFRSAEYLDKKARIPDLRTALYWNPEVVTDENGIATFYFYSTDVTGTFAIQVEGITSDGKPFFKEETFTVKFVPASD